MSRAIRMVEICTFAFCLLGLGISSSLADRRDDDDRRGHSNQSAPSSSRGSDSSSRMVVPSQPPTSNGGAARALNFRMDQSTQVPSLDRAVKSFNDSGRATFYSGRGLDNGAYGGRSDGSSSSVRSFGSQTFGRAGDAVSSPNKDNGTSNSQDRDSVPRSQPSTWTGRDWQRTGMNKNNSDGSNANNSGSVNSLQGGTNNSRSVGRGNNGQVGSQDSSRRLTDDRVADFLQLRRDGDTSPTFRTGRPVPNNVLGNNRTDQKNVPSATLKNSQLDLRERVKDSLKQGDDAWAKRFGDPNTNPINGKAFDRTGLAGKTNNSQLSNAVLRSDKKADPAFVNRAYTDWRKSGTGKGDKPGSDNRDWSGRWKDGERLLAAEQVRGTWKHHQNVKDVPFSHDWWHDHNDHHGHWHWDHFGDHHRPYYWWDSCSAPRLNTWFVFDWGTPCYWDYGPGEYIYCNNGVVFVNGVWFEPAPVFYRRTLLIADRVPNWTIEQAAQVEWLPLGVFVISRDGVPDNNVLVQLAVTKDGVIGGTIFNQLTGASFPVQGSVDKETQRAVWSYTDDTGGRIVMESSIFNLTQPAATGLIHYSPENMQVIELVRLEQPAVTQ